MDAYRYLIVGGGMTADAACRGVRDHDPDGAIGLFAAEAHAPYARPPLSKALWAGKDEGSIWRNTPELGVDVHLARRIVSLDLDAHTVTDDDGEVHAYERLLLATGGTPRRLPAGGDGVVYFRTLDDFRHLHALASDGVRVAVIGGGFIGSEIAAALATSGCAVTIVFPEGGIGARLFPSGLSSFVNEYYRSKSVDVVPEELVEEIARDGSTFRLTTDAVRAIEAAGDVERHTVVNIGHPEVVPMIELAEMIRLELGADPNLIRSVPIPPQITLVKHPSLERQRLLLGFEPHMPLQEGVRRVCAVQRGRAFPGAQNGAADKDTIEAPPSDLLQVPTGR